MPRVYSESGGLPTARKVVLAQVDDELYQWFIDEVLIEEKSIEAVLTSIADPDEQRALNNYIIYRLAEVDPGHVGKVMGL